MMATFNISVKSLKVVVMSRFGRIDTQRSVSRGENKYMPFKPTKRAAKVLCVSLPRQPDTEIQELQPIERTRYWL
jgi:hypothetical protein